MATDVLKLIGDIRRRLKMMTWREGGREGGGARGWQPRSRADVAGAEGRREALLAQRGSWGHVSRRGSERLCHVSRSHVTTLVTATMLTTESIYSAGELYCSALTECRRSALHHAGRC